MGHAAIQAARQLVCQCGWIQEARVEVRRFPRIDDNGWKHVNWVLGGD
jgi:hypothetical protein